MRAVNEIGVGDTVKIFGGGMVGLQFASIMESMGSLLNGVINYNSWLPEPSMDFGHQGVLRQVHAARRSRPRSIRSATTCRRSATRSGQMLEQAVNATKSLDHKVLADYLRTNELKTIVGPIAFAPDGERKVTATLQAQFRGVVDKNVDQFRDPGKQVILFPDNLKTGEVIVPFEAASK